MLYNRSYTTGHKSYRARATVELGTPIGWDNAHDVVYAGVPDIAVGPRWYSTYEMGCLVVPEPPRRRRDRRVCSPTTSALTPPRRRSRESSRRS